MRRRAPDETVAKFRSRQVALEVVELRGDLIEWASIYSAELSRADPTMPDGLEDRTEDCWAPLLAIADMAGKEWGEQARVAALLIAKGRVAEDASIGVRLLADIKTVLGDRDRMSSAVLCSMLNALEESGWGGWNDGKGIGQRDLAKRLKAYGVISKVIKLSDGTTARGYMRGEFRDPFARYLRDGHVIDRVTSATNVTTTRSDVTEVTEVTASQRTTTTPLETFQHQVDTTLTKVNSTPVSRSQQTSNGLPLGWRSRKMTNGAESSSKLESAEKPSSRVCGRRDENGNGGGGSVARKFIFPARPWAFLQEKPQSRHEKRALLCIGFPAALRARIGHLGCYPVTLADYPDTVGART